MPGLFSKQIQIILLLPNEFPMHQQHVTWNVKFLKEFSQLISVIMKEMGDYLLKMRTFECSTFILNQPSDSLSMHSFSDPFNRFLFVQLFAISPVSVFVNIISINSNRRFCCSKHENEISCADRQLRVCWYPSLSLPLLLPYAHTLCAEATPHTKHIEFASLHSTYRDSHLTTFSNTDSYKWRRILITMDMISFQRYHDCNHAHLLNANNHIHIAFNSTAWGVKIEISMSVLLYYFGQMKCVNLLEHKSTFKYNKKRKTFFRFKCCLATHIRRRDVCMDLIKLMENCPRNCCGLLFREYFWRLIHSSFSCYVILTFFSFTKTSNFICITFRLQMNAFKMVIICNSWQRVSRTFHHKIIIDIRLHCVKKEFRNYSIVAYQLWTNLILRNDLWSCKSNQLCTAVLMQKIFHRFWTNIELSNDPYWIATMFILLHCLFKTHSFVQFNDNVYIHIKQPFE